MLADEGHDLLHAVESGEDEGEPHVVVALLELPNEFALGRILQDHGRGLDVRGDVFEGKMVMDRAGAEEPLRPGDLAEKQLIAHAGPVAVLGAQRPAYAGQEEVFSCLDFSFSASPHSELPRRPQRPASPRRILAPWPAKPRHAAPRCGPRSRPRRRNSASPKRKRTAPWIPRRGRS